MSGFPPVYSALFVGVCCLLLQSLSIGYRCNPQVDKIDVKMRTVRRGLAIVSQLFIEWLVPPASCGVHFLTFKD